MNHLTDAELMAFRQATVEEVRKFADNVASKLARTERRLAIAETFIPLSKRDLYETLAETRSYGGSDPDG